MWTVDDPGVHTDSLVSIFVSGHKATFYTATSEWRVRRFSNTDEESSTTINSIRFTLRPGSQDVLLVNVRDPQRERDLVLRRPTAGPQSVGLYGTYQSINERGPLVFCASGSAVTMLHGTSGRREDVGRATPPLPARVWTHNNAILIAVKESDQWLLYTIDDPVYGEEGTITGFTIEDGILERTDETPCRRAEDLFATSKIPDGVWAVDYTGNKAGEMMWAAITADADRWHYADAMIGEISGEFEGNELVPTNGSGPSGPVYIIESDRILAPLADNSLRLFSKASRFKQSRSFPQPGCYGAGTSDSVLMMQSDGRLELMLPTGERMRGRLLHTRGSMLLVSDEEPPHPMAHLGIFVRRDLADGELSLNFPTERWGWTAVTRDAAPCSSSNSP
ncbi:MAG: hypothetical protein AAFV53_19320 [Myxococcota bacterium]